MVAVDPKWLCWDHKCWLKRLFSSRSGGGCSSPTGLFLLVVGDQIGFSGTINAGCGGSLVAGDVVIVVVPKASSGWL